MNAVLKNYSGPYRMVVVAKNEETLAELKARAIDAVFVHTNSIELFPEEINLELDELTEKRLDELADYDIIEISPNGLIYRSFAAEEKETTLFMGGACNSNCIMCPASDTERRRGNAYSEEFLLKYIDYLPTDIPDLVITGGEPTMNRDLFLKALNKVKEKFPNAYVLMLSNGRSLSYRPLADALAAARPEHFRIAIPLHGDCPELHDRITRAPGSFRQTEIGIKRMLARNIPVEIRIVVTKVNCDSTMAIAEHIVKNYPQVQCVNFIGLEPLGNCALNFEKVFIDYAESFRKSREAIDFLIQNGIDTALYNYPLCSVDSRYWPICSKSISSYKNGFTEDCGKCSVQDICPGFFDSALRFVKPAVHPI